MKEIDKLLRVTIRLFQFARCNNKQIILIRGVWTKCQLHPESLKVSSGNGYFFFSSKIY